MTLSALPDEIIKQVLYYLPPERLIQGPELTCRRLHRLSNDPLLWRYHCLHGFEFWSSEHDFPRKLQLPVTQVDWRELFRLRKIRELRAAQLLNGLLTSRKGHVGVIEKATALGYDVKDFLLEQCQIQDTAEDALSRQ
jgi:F-box protein 21